MSVVKKERHAFIQLMEKIGMLHQIYPSKHFFERVVERNLETVDVGIMLVPIIRDFRETTFNVRSYCVKWKQFRLFAKISVGSVTNRRQLVLKTIYDIDVDESNFDVVVQL